MLKASVIIPVYKCDVDSFEAISLHRTFSVLKSYSHVLVCPDDLNVDNYVKIADSEGVALLIERFNPSFFDGIKGYNRLLLSECFYERFADYEYMLICQADAFVFQDELCVWCEKGYDYAGAPIFGDCFDLGKAKVGNGGFCLRRVQAYLDFFKGKKHVFAAKEIANRISFLKKPYTRGVVLLLMCIGWRNMPRTVAERWHYNEDVFWSIYLNNSNYELSKPSVSEALTFAFERFPAECFRQIGRLPFGCHAWRKYQYEEFWKGHV